MKIAYILLVHRYPQQVARLVKRLNTSEVSFIIHVDKNSGQQFYGDLSHLLKGFENVYFVKDRVACVWGRFGIVEATNQAISELLQLPVNFDYAVLLSGQDYPIKSTGKIKEFLEANKGMNFIEAYMFPHEKWRFGGYEGINIYIFDLFKSKFDFVLSILLFKILRYKRKYLFGLYPDYYPYGGSQWWCLTREAVQYINDFVRENRKFSDFYRHCISPDEMFFHTILMNSPLQGKCIADNLRYIEWPSEKSLNPATLTKQSYENLINSNCFFARKFDMNIDSDILDILDDCINNT